MLEFIDIQLEKATIKNQKRALFEANRESGFFTIDDKRVIDLCSNDYLNLSQHSYLKEKSAEYSNKYGTGATASRLVCGTMPITTKIEKKLAIFKQSETALLFNSGYQANVSLLSSLCTKHSLLIMDKFCHNSLIQGALLSKAKILRYKHNDLSHLEKLLQNVSAKSFDRIFIVTESIFGMDGDIVDIDQLCFLAKKYQVQIYLDEAHAMGILGKNGEGLSVNKTNILISMGTFGKSFGSFGAFVSCSNKLKDYLINYCHGIIFSTALPPQILGAIDAALDLVPKMEKERIHILNLAEKFRKSILLLGYNTTNVSSHIIPLITGSETSCLKLFKYLIFNGIFSAAIRPPTVSQNMSRIRFAISAKHTEKDINKVITLLKNYPEKDILCQR